MPRNVKSVLLIKFSDVNTIERLLKNVKPNIIQIQKEADGLEIAKILRTQFPDIEIIKTFYNAKDMTREKLYHMIDEYVPYIDAVNLDAEKGGGGKRHDWDITADVSKYVKEKKISFILSGGLDAHNIEEAYYKIKPDMIDIMSGTRLEGRLDKKGPRKIEQIMNVVNRINSYEIQ